MLTLLSTTQTYLVRHAVGENNVKRKCSVVAASTRIKKSWRERRMLWVINSVNRNNVSRLNNEFSTRYNALLLSHTQVGCCLPAGTHLNPSALNEVLQIYDTASRGLSSARGACLADWSTTDSTKGVLKQIFHVFCSWLIIDNQFSVLSGNAGHFGNP